MNTHLCQTCSCDLTINSSIKMAPKLYQCRKCYEIGSRDLSPRIRFKNIRVAYYVGVVLIPISSTSSEVFSSDFPKLTRHDIQFSVEGDFILVSLCYNMSENLTEVIGYKLLSTQWDHIGFVIQHNTEAENLFDTSHKIFLERKSD